MEKGREAEREGGSKGDGEGGRVIALKSVGRVAEQGKCHLHLNISLANYNKNRMQLTSSSSPPLLFSPRPG